VLCNKATTIAMSSVCGSESSKDILLHETPVNISAHLSNQTCAQQLFFILFVSSRLGMCDRLNSLECMAIRWSLICPIKLPQAHICYLNFASFNAPHNNAVGLLYEKGTASIQLFILHLLQSGSLYSPKKDGTLKFVLFLQMIVVYLTGQKPEHHLQVC